MTPFKTLTMAAALVASLGVFGVAHAGEFFFEGDMVRGPTADGLTGPSCVLANQYMRLEKVVWRVRVLNAAGENVNGDMLKSLVIQISDGQEFPAKFGQHPRGEPTDNFWATSWQIPADYPTGTMTYKVIATSLDGKVTEWSPFNVAPSLLTVIPGEVTFTKPN